ncbi:MAG: hypothetical protein AB7U38_13160 [Hyphomicrobiales bacterium]
MMASAQQPWAGGARPLHPDARVYVTYRDGITSKIRRAGDLRWEHTDLPDDIVAFSVDPESEAWAKPEAVD